jgi:nucleoside-diphosphate-sugar epimerase
VYSSTVGTIGVAEHGRPASEDSLARFDHLFGHYKRSKYLAEHEVLRACARATPVVLLHPTPFRSVRATPREARPAA